jgi:hypothetical protein
VSQLPPGTTATANPPTDFDAVAASLSATSGTDSAVVQGLGGVSDPNGVRAVAVLHGKSYRDREDGLASRADVTDLGAYTLSNLEDDTEYHLWVEATDAADVPVTASRYLGALRTKPMPSLDGIVVSGVAVDSITISNLAVVYPGVDVKIDAVYGTADLIGGDGNVTALDVGAGGAATFEIRPLRKNTAYNVWLRFRDPSGNASDPPRLLTARTTNADPPVGVDGVTVRSVSTDTIVLQGLGGIADAVDGVAKIRIWHGVADDIALASVHEFAP